MSPRGTGKGLGGGDTSACSGEVKTMYWRPGGGETEWLGESAIRGGDW